MGNPIFLCLCTLNALALVDAILVIIMVFGGMSWFRPRLRLFFPYRIPDGQEWADELYAGMIFRIFEYQLIRTDAQP